MHRAVADRAPVVHPAPDRSDCCGLDGRAVVDPQGSEVHGRGLGQPQLDPLRLRRQAAEGHAGRLAGVEAEFVPGRAQVDDVTDRSLHESDDVPVHNELERRRLEFTGELADERQLDIELKGGRRAGEFQSHACRHLDDCFQCDVRELGLRPSREPAGREARQCRLKVEGAREAEYLGVDGNVPHYALFGIGAGSSWVKVLHLALTTADPAPCPRSRLHFAVGQRVPRWFGLSSHANWIITTMRSASPSLPSSFSISISVDRAGPVGFTGSTAIGRGSSGRWRANPLAGVRYGRRCSG